MTYMDVDAYNTKVMEECLHSIFVFYANSIGGPTIRGAKFQKIAIDADLLDDRLTSQKVDLIYKSVCGHSQPMTYEKFKNAIVLMALEKFPNEDSQQRSIIKIFDEYFSSFNDPRQTAFHHLDQDFFKVLAPYRSHLAQIYEHYFKEECAFLRNEEKYFTALASNSLKNFGRMVNDFEIVPFLLSKPNAYGLFRDVAKKKIIPDYIRNELEIYLPDKSDRKVFGVFTYVHFLCALTLIGDKICDGVIESYFPKHTQNTKPFIYLMGHMIAANPLKGKFFLDFPLDSRHQLNAVSPSRTSLFSDDPTGQRRKGGGLGRSSDFAPSQRRVSQNNAVQRKSTPGRLQDENNAPKSAPSLHQRVVKQLFSYYAALGSPMNRTFMSTIKWNRFLRDAGILDDTVKKEGFNRSPSRSLSPRQSQRLRRSMSSAESDMERVVSPLRGSAKKGMLTLKQVDADLIFLQSQNNNTVRHHMTEDIFEIALTFLAEKLYDQKLEKFIHSDGAYVALVNDILRPLSEKLQSINGNEIQGCAVAFQQPEITRVFKTAEDGLDRLFKSYTRTSSHGTLWSAEKFSKFCNDFEITNELSHKPLQRIFSDCVHFFYAQGKGHAREMSKETFQLALLMVAIHLTKDEELSLPKKLAMLFHRFNSVGSSNNLKGGKSAFLRVNASLYSPPREVPLRRSAVAASLRNSYTWSALMNDPLAGRLTEPTAAR